MTVSQAHAFVDHMSKKKVWTSPEMKKLREASQVIRYAQRRKYSLNPPSKNVVVIYRRVLAIYAQKQGPHRCDAECKRLNHNYVHEFKPGAVMYGLPDGDLLIRSTK